MTRREIAVAAVVLAVLAALAAWQRRPREAPPAGPQPVLALPAPDEITAIELTQAGDGERAGRLERRDGGWVLASHADAPGDDERIGRLLDAVDGLVGEVRTDDPGLLPELRLAGDGVIDLTLVAGEGPPVLLHVGKRGPRSNRSFVRPEGDERAWLAHAPLHAALGLHGRGEQPLEPTFFVDQRLLRVEPDDVLAVVVRGEQPWGIVRDGGDGAWRWEPDDGGAAAPEERAATGKAHAASRLRATDLVGTEPPPGALDDAGTEIEVRTAGGGARVLVVGGWVPPERVDGETTAREPDERFVRVRGEPWVWRVRAASLDALAARPE